MITSCCNSYVSFFMSFVAFQRFLLRPLFLAALSAAFFAAAEVGAGAAGAGDGAGSGFVTAEAGVVTGSAIGSAGAKTGTGSGFAVSSFFGSSFAVASFFGSSFFVSSL